MFVTSENLFGASAYPILPFRERCPWHFRSPVQLSQHIITPRTRYMKTRLQIWKTMLRQVSPPELPNYQTMIRQTTKGVWEYETFAMPRLVQETTGNPEQKQTVRTRASVMPGNLIIKPSFQRYGQTRDVKQCCYRCRRAKRVSVISSHGAHTHLANIQRPSVDREAHVVAPGNRRVEERDHTGPCRR